jgi:hypothetical protein
MVMVLSEPVAIEKKSSLGYIAGFMLHTYVAYTCALHLSAWLVFHWFGWIMPILHISTSLPATDWYLQHFELMTILPALVVGYVNVARFLPGTVRTFIHEDGHSIAPWVWILPTLVLLYRLLLEYHAPSASVLYSSPMTGVKYFFDIAKVMPTRQTFLFSDPIRVWAQMSVTAPFYAGVAYSVGALASKYDVLAKLFTFEKHDEPSAEQDCEAAPER